MVRTIETHTAEKSQRASCSNHEKKNIIVDLNITFIWM